MNLRTAGGILTLCATLAAGTALAQRRPPSLAGSPPAPQIQGQLQKPPVPVVPVQGQTPSEAEAQQQGQAPAPQRPAPGPQRPAPAPQRPAPAPSARPTPPPAPAPQQTITPQTAQGSVERQRATCEQVRRKARFNVYFDNVEIAKLVQTVADATCKTFILPENVRGKISIIGPENGRVEVTADEFYRAFLAALDANSLAVYQQGDFLKIVDKRNAKQTPIPTIVDPDAPYTYAEQMVTKIFKIKYVEVEPLRGVLQQLVSQNGDTIPFPPDTIIINDLGSNMHRLSRLIEQLDSRSSSEELRIIQINYANAQEIADKIQKLFTPAQGTARPGQRGASTRAAAAPPPGGTVAPGVAAAEGGGEAGGEGAGGPVTVSQIIPDERTNKIILVASPGGYERVLDLVKMLDVPIPGEGRINVYYLENADSEELASTLQSLAQGTSGGGPQRPGRAAAQPAAAGGARGPAQATSAELFAGEVKISADKATNSLVIIASQADFRNLVKVIEKLDVQRKQVFVEAVIMEVNVDRNLAYGARLHGGVPVKTDEGTLPLIFGSKFGQETIPPSFSVLNLANFGGFLAGLQGPVVPALERLGINIPAFGVLIHALQESSDVNVLSTPHILTVDNEEAEISVGQNVPFQAGIVPGSLAGLSGLGGLGGLTGQTGATAGVNPALAAGLLGGLGSVVAPINRQNVELKLTVKPQINESDYIRMVITEQIEEIASTDPVLGPTTAKRTAKTTIVARDQETVVIGGIMQDRTIEGVNKVPVLGDIPLVGQLFRETTRRKVKTNLLLFLTPYIIKDSSDFRRIFERKMKERQQFVETFYGQVPGYEVAVDFDRKRGPLSEIDATVRRELQKVENGGRGQPGERVFVPGGAPTSVAPGSSGQRLEGGEGSASEGEQGGGEVSPEESGSGEAPAMEPNPDVPDPREEIQTE